MIDEQHSNPDTYQLGDWEFKVSDNSLRNRRSQHVERLEPRVGDLLKALLKANHEVVSKETLMEELWPSVVVGEDTLAKTVSRLRAALGESAAQPNFIETIPKRGYRIPQLMVERESEETNSIAMWAGGGFAVAVLTLLVGWLIYVDLPDDELSEKLQRADGLYMEFDERSNEAALALYEDVLSVEQSNSHAQAGVANAMVQRVVRWPETEAKGEAARHSMTSALASGQLSTPEARLMLERARLLAEKAVRESPNSTQALKALGFVYSAEGKLQRAMEQYQRAISLDATEWRSMVNLGELLSLNQQPEAALNMFTRAYVAMQANFDQEPQHIGPWQPALGVVIAQLHMQSKDHKSALSWSKKVLELEPFERDASSIFVSAALALGNQVEAQRFCESYAIKLEAPIICKDLL